MKPPTFSTDKELVADTALIRQAITSNQLEVRLGEIARERANDSAVEDFAGEMVEDHGSMGRKWVGLARASRLPVETTLGPAQEALVRRLEILSGAEFDRAYMTSMIQNHDGYVATLQRVQQCARSSEVRELAATDLTTVQEHLTTARELGRRIGVSTFAGRTPIRPDDRTRPEDRTEPRRDDDNRGHLAPADRDFVHDVLIDHEMEIRLAKRAQREANREKTRDFAEELRKDLEKWQKRWEALASRKDLEWNEKLDKAHRNKVQRLDAAKDRRFDRTYAAIVAENLESILSDFLKQRKAARAVAVRRTIEEELPVIREHLAEARRVEQLERLRADASKK